VQLVLTGHDHKEAIFDISGSQVDNRSANRPLFIQTRSATKDETGDLDTELSRLKME